MKNIILFLLMLLPNVCFATTWQPYFIYQPTSTVTNTNLNGNNNALGNIINGGLDNSNANTSTGYRFYQTVGSLPSFGNQGAVYFLTAGNTLNFDTGSSFIQTLTVPASTTQGNTIYYGASGWTTLAPGTSGQLLETLGAGANPQWETINYQNVQAPYVKVSETEVSGTAGGSGTTGSWITRILNTKDTDTSSIASLTSNQVTLPAGTYIVEATSPFHAVNMCQARLQNITASTTLLTGTSCSADAASASVTNSMITGLITLSVSSAVAVQYQISTHTNTNDLGLADSFGTEVYTVAEFTKVQ